MRKLIGVLMVLLVVLPTSGALGENTAWEIKYLGNTAPTSRADYYYDNWGSCGVWNGKTFSWKPVSGNYLLGAVVDDPDAIDGKAYRINDNSGVDSLLWRTDSENIDTTIGATIVARVKKVSETNGSGNIGIWHDGGTGAYHWGGPTGHVWEPYRNVGTSVSGDENYHILRLAIAGKGANAPYSEPFAYADGSLSGQNDWNGGSAGIVVESQSVKILGGSGELNCTTPIYARADEYGVISVKVKFKQGAGSGSTIHNFYAMDTAGKPMARWSGTANSIKPRKADANDAGPEQILTDNLFHQTEVKIYPYTNKVEYYFEQVAGSGVMTLLSTWTYSATTFANELGEIKVSRIGNAEAAGHTCYYYDLDVAGEPVPGAGRRVNLYLDEDSTPKVTINNASKVYASPDAFTMGCPDVAGTEDLYIDWIVGSAAGAFAPGEEEEVIGHSLLIDPTVVTTIADAKKAPEHAQVELAEVHVTSVIKAWDEFGNTVPVGFTVADYRDVNPSDPYNPVYKATQGIRVVYNLAPVPIQGPPPDWPYIVGFTNQGQHVKISGTCETRDGERIIVANHVEEVLTMMSVLGPQCVNNKMSGGGVFGMQPALVGDVTRRTGMPSYDEPFTYADGALVGKGFWTGSAGSEIGVSGNQLTITSPGAAKNAIQERVFSDCGSGTISVKVKAKAGSGESNFWTLTVLDPAGKVFGYWMGKGTAVRGRTPVGSSYTPEQSLDAN